MRIALTLFGRSLFAFEVAFEDAPEPALPFGGMSLPMMLAQAGAVEPCTDECCQPPAPEKPPLGFTAPAKKP